MGKNSRQIVAAPDKTISYGKTRLSLARAIPTGIRSVYFEEDSCAGCREPLARGATQHTATRRWTAGESSLPFCDGGTGPFFIAARNAGNSPRRLRREELSRWMQRVGRGRGPNARVGGKSRGGREPWRGGWGIVGVQTGRKRAKEARFQGADVSGGASTPGYASSLPNLASPQGTRTFAPLVNNLSGNDALCTTTCCFSLRAGDKSGRKGYQRVRRRRKRPWTRVR